MSTTGSWWRGWLRGRRGFSSQSVRLSWPWPQAHQGRAACCWALRTPTLSSFCRCASYQVKDQGSRVFISGLLKFLWLLASLEGTMIRDVLLHFLCIPMSVINHSTTASTDVLVCQDNMRADWLQIGIQIIHLGSNQKLLSSFGRQYFLNAIKPGFHHF